MKDWGNPFQNIKNTLHLIDENIQAIEKLYS